MRLGGWWRLLDSQTGSFHSQETACLFNRTAWTNEVLGCSTQSTATAACPLEGKNTLQIAGKGARAGASRPQSPWDISTIIEEGAFWGKRQGVTRRLMMPSEFRLGHTFPSKCPGQEAFCLLPQGGASSARGGGR